MFHRRRAMGFAAHPSAGQGRQRLPQCLHTAGHYGWRPWPRRLPQPRWRQVCQFQPRKHRTRRVSPPELDGVHRRVLEGNQRLRVRRFHILHQLEIHVSSFLPKASVHRLKLQAQAFSNCDNATARTLIQDLVPRRARIVDMVVRSVHVIFNSKLLFLKQQLNFEGKVSILECCGYYLSEGFKKREMESRS